MILVCEGRAKERHNPVAHHLIDRALVPMDRLHHALEDRVEDLARFFRIAIGEQLHRAFEVGEEHRDLLALTLEIRLGGEDLLGEVLGGVGLGRSKARLPSGWSTDCLAALKTELRSRRKLCAALATRVSESSPAL